MIVRKIPFHIADIP